MLKFDNRFTRELPGDVDVRNLVRQVRGACWSPVKPTPVSAPVLLASSREMATALDLDPEQLAKSPLLDALAGNAVLPGMHPYAACYGGHQFGNWAGQLGDGRAIALGEVINRAGERWELQLKGAGPTPYSRRADGRAVLRSSVREFLCSEAMHHLGIPTTRALSLVGTGDTVLRDMFYDGNPEHEPGAIVCRVSPSFIRFGNFEIFASRGEKVLLKQLVDFTIARDFPEIDTGDADHYARWFSEVCSRTGCLMARWMQVGFVHGVMNTDNMSILGLTIDYGPYGWVEDFDPGWTPNTTDEEGRRYCYGRQPEIARWNLERLADALQLLIREEHLAAGISAFDAAYGEEATRLFAGKFGFAEWREEDAELTGELFAWMQEAEVDMTIFFRQLACVDPSRPDTQLFNDAFYRDELRQQHAPALESWLQRYTQRLQLDNLPSNERAERMNHFNPRYVLRNYLAQEAIDRATQGDTSGIADLLEVMRRPYTEQAGREAFAAKRPEWARHKAGCSMLSCSS